jgi:hypothetical protein
VPCRRARKACLPIFVGRRSQNVTSVLNCYMPKSMTTRRKVCLLVDKDCCYCIDLVVASQGGDQANTKHGLYSCTFDGQTIRCREADEKHREVSRRYVPHDVQERAVDHMVSPMGSEMPLWGYE